MNNTCHIIYDQMLVWRAYLIYIAISTVTWSTIARFVGHRALFRLVLLPGTLLHELTHFIIGVLTNAQPNSFSIIPNHTKLGSVSFTHLTWYNAIPTTLAPLLGLASISVAAIHNLPQDIQRFTPQNLYILVLLSPMVYACWPSSVDWRLSLRGWPIYVFAIVYVAYTIKYH